MMERVEFARQVYIDKMDQSSQGRSVALMLMYYICTTNDALNIARKTHFKRPNSH
jgi:hypothetical protein